MKKILLSLLTLITLNVVAQKKIKLVTSDQAVAINVFKDNDSTIYTYDNNCRVTDVVKYIRNNSNVMALSYVEEYKNYDNQDRPQYYSGISYDANSGAVNYGTMFKYRYVGTNKDLDSVYVYNNGNWLLYGINQWFFTGDRVDSIHRYNAPNYPPTLAPELNFRTIGTSYNANGKVTHQDVYYNPNIGVSAPVWNFYAEDTAAYGLNDSLVFYEYFDNSTGVLKPSYKYIYTQNDSARYDTILYFNWVTLENNYKLVYSIYKYYQGQITLDSINQISYQFGQPGVVVDKDLRYHYTYDSNDLVVYQLTTWNYNGTIIDYNKRYFDYVDCATIGVEKQLAKKSLVVYPNPATAQQLVSVNSDNVIQQIHIYNVLGDKVSTMFVNSPNAQLETKQLKQGVYFLDIITNVGSTTERLVIY